VYAEAADCGHARVTAATTDRADELPFSRDPFDALITCDARIRSSGVVTVIW
jgi:PIN domain nuclease of toxin-antitoxin system